MKRKGQASAEYIALVAGGALFVLIVVVAVNGFFNAPAKQSVIEQGSLVQQQFGSLSHEMEKGKPLSYRKPLVYEGLAESPSDFTYVVQSCIHRVDFWSNVSGTYQLTNTIEQTVDPENTGDYNVFLNMVQNSIAAPGFYEFNLNVCNCQDVCQWLYADENNNPVNQIIEIVPQGDARYAAAKQRTLSQGDPYANFRRGPIALSATANLAWTCDLGVPLIEGTATVKGDALQSVQLFCDVNGRQIQNQIQNIQTSGQYRVRILDQNAQGQTTCYVTACNSTDCTDSQHKQYQTCQVPLEQGVGLDNQNTSPVIDGTTGIVSNEGLVVVFSVSNLANSYDATIIAATRVGGITAVNYTLHDLQNDFNSKTVIGDAIGFDPRQRNDIVWSLHICNPINNCDSAVIPIS